MRPENTPLRDNYPAFAEPLAVIGIGPERLIEIGLVDQEASLHLNELTRRLAALFREFGVRDVLTHPYEGGHPDHDAAAFAVHGACRLIDCPPRRIEFASYHNQGGW